MTKRLLCLLGLPLLAVASGACSPSGASIGSEAGVAAAIRTRLTAGDVPEYAADDPDCWKAAQAAYERNGYRPMWTDEKGLRPQVESLKKVIASSPQDGLNPAHYDLTPVEALKVEKGGSFLSRTAADPAQIAEAEARLTVTFFRLSRDLMRGRVEPGKVDKHWFGTRREADLLQVFKASMDSGDVSGKIQGLSPQHPQYASLKQALARYRDIAAKGGWPALPGSLGIKPGQAAPEVATLKARLLATGDLAGTSAAPAATSSAAPGQGAPAAAVYDDAVREAVRRFERRHGLKDDGLLDADVLAAMNVPVADRVRQIELNLERWRWMPEQLGAEHILVNIPTYHLQAFEQNRPALEMRVVAGKTESPTPIFSDTMETVVFSPYWNVPPDIAREETIPAVQRDPGHLAANNLEVLRGDKVVSPWGVDWSDASVRIRQRPGPKNSLGNVKFLFPNNFDVYLHDTPADSLFGRIERGFSHGCVRLEKPFELAQWVLRHQSDWTPERIQAAMSAGEEKHVALKNKIPVYIVYETVWVDGDGGVKFAEDVYGHDTNQAKLLPASLPPAAPAKIARR